MATSAFATHQGGGLKEPADRKAMADAQGAAKGRFGLGNIAKCESRGERVAVGEGLAGW